MEDKKVCRQIRVTTTSDLIRKAYYAGLITSKSEVTIWGIGSKGGTNWAIGTELALTEIQSTTSHRACKYFTSIFNHQKKNMRRTHNKKTYYLTQFEEVQTLIEYFGLGNFYRDHCNDLLKFDRFNDLEYEIQQKKVIRDWENRTKHVIFRLHDHDWDIFDAVIDKLSDEYVYAPALKPLLENAFVEGLNGWVLGASDVTLLTNGKSMGKQYDKAS